MSNYPLFGESGFTTPARGRLSNALDIAWLNMEQLLQEWDPDDLLNSSVDDVREQLLNKGLVLCPRIRAHEAFQLEPQEVDQQYDDWGVRRTRKVTRLVLVVPFDGQRYVLTLRPDRFTMAPPRVLQLTPHHIHFAIDNPPDSPTAVRAGFESQIADVEQWLGWSREQIDPHNVRVRHEAPLMVTRRRDQLLATRNLQAAIGYPVLRRPDADSYAVPVTRRTVRPQPQRPSDARAPFKPEPAMRETDYQAALQVLKSQQNALERSPSLVAKLNEEEIRDILLVGLNAQFEGAAGGELFNGAGKTDILIRVEDRNIFIGECKVWSGPKTMDAALDQLFGYLMWRDTKAAILLFIRNYDVTTVIDRAIAKIEKHPNWKRSSPRQAKDTQYGFVMHSQDDPRQEIHLTLIPFALRPN